MTSPEHWNKYRDGTWALFDLMQEVDAEELKQLLDEWQGEHVADYIEIMRIAEFERPSPHTFIAIPIEEKDAFIMTGGAKGDYNPSEQLFITSIVSIDDIINLIASSTSEPPGPLQ